MLSAPYTVKPFVDIHGGHRLRVLMAFPDPLTEGTKHIIGGDLCTEQSLHAENLRVVQEVTQGLLEIMTSGQDHGELHGPPPLYVASDT